ncbi:serine hydrolase domain-containing protein [Vibrio scophthalmi]|uniref:Serine-type D-Ala-D-Ala carboxypeptidase n=1 Tax=Vibrio scophthalmi TaxID=45658 RepID=A0A1B1NNP6_9VIBR|nr:serine hydrolase domain-containing protein [Vibrio scophthalmi]ANS85369.1 Serine-type D-Ala-D-Ala carboxypeptidase [Vibrio scophthalmi]ANU36352.1 Serine-type D-Ala-D-Ala carboxypeptidase [Vibrio scophthalmi]
MQQFSGIFTMLMLSFVILSGDAAAREFNKSKLDDYLSSLNDANKVMLSIEITERGAVTYRNQTGYVDIKKHFFTQDDYIPASPNTRYKIASITKTFTATLIFQLIEQGKLQLSTPLSQFYPQVPNAENITVDDLLSHHSGIVNFLDQEAFYSNIKSDYTLAGLVELIASYPARPYAMRDFRYSNSNYILLTGIIEQVTGNTYEHALYQQIIDPLKLSDTQYCSGAKGCEGYAQSYIHYDQGIVTADEWPKTTFMGTGGITSTPTDLNRFNHALYQGKLISEASLKYMKGEMDYRGKGLEEIYFHSRTLVGHGGLLEGFRTLLAYLEDDALSIAIACNLNDMELRILLIEILDIYYESE